MIQVNGIGRFGNNFWQYCLGRIIAEKTGYQFSFVNTNKDLNEVYDINIKYGSMEFENQDHFTNAVSFIPGIVKGDPIIVQEHNYDSVDQIIQFAGDRGVILNGFFQRLKYFLPYREKIREWFKTDWMPRQQGNDFVLHVRHEDYEQDLRLPISYYEEALEQLYSNCGARFGYFVGKDLSLEVQDQFLKLSKVWKLKHYNVDSSFDCFQFIKSFNNIVCANSSFSAMAAFLSDASRIFIPRPTNPRSYWSLDQTQEMYEPNLNHILIEC